MSDFALAMINDAVPPQNVSESVQDVSEDVEVYLVNVTAAAGDDVDSTVLLPVEFVVVLVLAAACILVGVVYAYIHITRAARARREKRKRRPSSFVSHQHHVNKETSGDEGSRQTHLMFFRRSATTTS